MASGLTKMFFVNIYLTLLLFCINLCKRGPFLKLS